MPCLYHTDMHGPDEYFVTPFDAPHRIRCQCPGGCAGFLQAYQRNVHDAMTFLICSVCGCAYDADDHKDKPE